MRGLVGDGSVRGLFPGSVGVSGSPPIVPSEACGQRPSARAKGAGGVPGDVAGDGVDVAVGCGLMKVASVWPGSTVRTRSRPPSTRSTTTTPQVTSVRRLTSRRRRRRGSGSPTAPAAPRQGGGAKPDLADLVSVVVVRPDRVPARRPRALAFGGEQRHDDVEGGRQRERAGQLDAHRGSPSRGISASSLSAHSSSQRDFKARATASKPSFTHAPLCSITMSASGPRKVSVVQ